MRDEGVEADEDGEAERYACPTDTDETNTIFGAFPLTARAESAKSTRYLTPATSPTKLDKARLKSTVHAACTIAVTALRNSSSTSGEEVSPNSGFDKSPMMKTTFPSCTPTSGREASYLARVSIALGYPRFRFLMPKSGGRLHRCVPCARLRGGALGVTRRVRR